MLNIAIKYVKVSIYVCTMSGNKDINRRIIVTLNRTMCGNICVLFFVLLKTRNFCIIMCNVQVSIYVCTMCGNKDINRRIILTLNRIICGNICVLLFSLFFVLLKTRNFCIIMCKNSQLDRVIPKGNRKIKFLTPYVPFLSFIMVRFKYLTKKNT